MSRSASSSPDVLAPPGDADYLISSPFKPFSGRQSFMSPANFRLLQHPRKRQRITLSPDKRSHSIRFDDILLPGSPTMRLNDQPRSPSPDKFAPEANVSPWKIRLTLEATQDENSQGSPSRKRRASSTKTTKVPLRDEQDRTTQTPRRRGRPRKSTVQGSATPKVGSPGHTPGPGGTVQKRKRGRPRKSVPESAVPQDTQIHDQTASIESEHGLDILNNAGDGDFDAGLQDDYPDDPFLEQAMEQRDMVSDRRTGDASSPRVSFNTPDVGAIDREYMEGDQYLHSTPSKMPSPSRTPHISSPDNTLHAGSTPGPRTYPTPTSSQVGEHQEQIDPNVSANGFYSDAHHSDGPADDPREFDSIMESEEFSMVSLGTLPSARQHGFNGNSKLGKGPLKPFIQREAIGITDHKKHRAPTTDSSPELPRQTRRSPNHRSPRLQSRSPLQSHPTSNHTTFADNVPRMAVDASFTRNPFRLARIVRVAIALAGTLKNQLGEVISKDASASEMEDSRRRLEDTFGGYSPEITRVLRAGLGLGQELAKRFSQAEAEKARQTAAAEATKLADDRDESEARTPRQKQGGVGRSDEVSSEMKRRMAEWQDEREAVSREIQMANSSQVIVIDSDDSEESERDYGDEPLGAGGVRLALEPVEEEEEEEQEPEQDPNPVEENVSDDGSVDIWQEEAKDRDHVSHRPSRSRHPAVERQLPSGHVSSQESSSSSAPNDANFPADWTKNNYLRQSRVKQLREQEVDLSPLFREEYTPRSYQYYYGKSSPASSGRQRQQSSGLAREEGNPIHQSDSQSKPNGDASGQLDLQGYDSYDLDQREEDEESVPSSSAAGQSIHKDANITPDSSRQTNPDIQGSSWFDRLTSFTPGWLRAPRYKPDKIPENEEEQPVSPEAIAEPVEEIESAPDPEPQQSPGQERQPKGPDPTQESPADLKTTGQEFKRKAKGRTAAETTQGLLDRKIAGNSSYTFSDAHYAELRRLFWHARRDRDAFPYYPLPGRSEMLGDWLMTSDGAYKVQITKEQFAIVDKFRLELEDPSTDLADGGWEEADLHQRLVSIIIGEHIRNERRRIE